MEAPLVRLEPWSDGDLELLWRKNTPHMTAHLGGPEPDEKVRSRHRRYLEPPEPGAGQMFRVVLLPDGVPVGTIGYWERPWRDQVVYETGWGVFPEFQGRGLAVAAGRELVARAAGPDRRHRYLHAFPSVGNPPSNGICRRLGFTLLGETDFEYPPGRWMRCNDWRLDLTAGG